MGEEALDGSAAGDAAHDKTTKGTNEKSTRPSASSNANAENVPQNAQAPGERHSFHIQLGLTCLLPRNGFCTNTCFNRYSALMARRCRSNGSLQAEPPIPESSAPSSQFLEGMHRGSRSLLVLLVQLNFFVGIARHI